MTQYHASTELQSVAMQALQLMDLTTLNDTDTDEIVRQLCLAASTSFGDVAAVCVYPQFIQTAKSVFANMPSSHIFVATVTNFPHGNDDVDQAVSETTKAVELGADEVDVVFPYRALMAGDEQVGFELVKRCKEACGDDVRLKVIIEVGELKTELLVKKASRIAIEAGADFIKTSTGKVEVNATPEYARMMLEVILEFKDVRLVGFKAAGGVRTVEDAQIYLDMATKLLGEQNVNAAHYRFGASSLLNNLLKTLGQESVTDSNSSY
jgi:deoxyribose-phosphate aldolase